MVPPNTAKAARSEYAGLQAPKATQQSRQILLHLEAGVAFSFPSFRQERGGGLAVSAFRAQPNCPALKCPASIDFLATRRSVPAQFLGLPAPDAAQLRQILAAGLRVPDHGKLAPWRFIRFAGDDRTKVGEAMLRLRLSRGDQLSDAERDKELTRFSRAPLVIGVVSKAGPHVKIPEWEQQLSAGAVCMNLLNGAHALGFSAQWVTGWPVYDPEARAILGLTPDERLAGLVHIGTRQIEPTERPRPEPDDLLTDWAGPGGA